MENLEEIKNIIVFHKSEKCFKCGTLVEKNTDGYFKCDCGFEWANLFIKRIPVSTFLLFKQISDNEFCSDYGLMLKSILDDVSKFQGIFELIQDHENRILKLEEKPVKEIKLLSGNKLEVKRSG
jgi:hypothetical protein